MPVRPGPPGGPTDNVNYARFGFGPDLHQDHTNAFMRWVGACGAPAYPPPRPPAPLRHLRPQGLSPRPTPAAGTWLIAPPVPLLRRGAHHVGIAPYKLHDSIAKTTCGKAEPLEWQLHRGKFTNTVPASVSAPRGKQGGRGAVALSALRVWPWKREAVARLCSAVHGAVHGAG